MYEPQVDDYVIWNRPNGDIEKLMNALPKMQMAELVTRYGEALSIDYHLFDAI